jgi:mycofactocin system transcriptional regulator
MDVVAARRTTAGRPPTTTRAEIEQVAFGLFDEQGFDATTVDDIATAAGIGRRTFFRYFASKNDVVWGEFDRDLARMAERFTRYDDAQPIGEVLRDAVVAYNALDPAEVARHRRRMALILHVPALQAHSTLRYTAWRQVVADYVAGRLGVAASSLAPQLAGHTALGAAVTAYEQWLADASAGSDELGALLDASLRAVADGLNALR